MREREERVMKESERRLSLVMECHWTGFRININAKSLRVNSRRLHARLPQRKRKEKRKSRVRVGCSREGVER